MEDQSALRSEKTKKTTNRGRRFYQKQQQRLQSFFLYKDLLKDILTRFEKPIFNPELGEFAAELLYFQRFTEKLSQDDLSEGEYVQIENELRNEEKKQLDRRKPIPTSNEVLTRTRRFRAKNAARVAYVGVLEELFQSRLSLLLSIKPGVKSDLSKIHDLLETGIDCCSPKEVDWEDQRTTEWGIAMARTCEKSGASKAASIHRVESCLQLTGNQPSPNYSRPSPACSGYCGAVNQSIRSESSHSSWHGSLSKTSFPAFDSPPAPQASMHCYAAFNQFQFQSNSPASFHPAGRDLSFCLQHILNSTKTTFVSCQDVQKAVNDTVEIDDEQEEALVKKLVADLPAVRDEDVMYSKLEELKRAMEIELRRESNLKKQFNDLHNEEIGACFPSEFFA